MLVDVDDAADRDEVRVDERGLAGDDDRFGHARDLHRDVESSGLADVDDDALRSNLLKPESSAVQVVGADRQRLQAVDAFRVGDFGADEAGRRRSSPVTVTPGTAAL